MDSTNNTFEYMSHWGISLDTFKFFDVKTEINQEGKPIHVHFKEPNGKTRVRIIDPKDFFLLGNTKAKGVFGKDKFSPGSAKAITITEGAKDALSVLEMMGKFPVVAVGSSNSAKADVAADWDYINSFEKIYLCLDNDTPGHEATTQIASLFDLNKVYHVKLQLKDANDYLAAGKTKEFQHIWWNAHRYMPEGILTSFTDFEDALLTSPQREGINLPWPTLQHMLGGIRKEEVLLVTALEGVGKTEFVRALENHILHNTPETERLGVIHLEETKARTLQGYASYVLGKPAHLPSANVSHSDVVRALAESIKIDGRLHLYAHSGTLDLPGALRLVRFLAGPAECGYIVLDHVSMVISGMALENERVLVDQFTTEIAAIARQAKCAIIIISHVNDVGYTRSSRNTSKVSDSWVHLNRDLTAASEAERSKMEVVVRKNRYKGDTGPAGFLIYNKNTCRLEEPGDSLLGPSPFLPPL